ncbi:bifunctional tRNA (mnm(5)s(2)U34)-methyltransferase/FAD-dependent cmnm(5)s(2)U34 oxidoreductase [Planctomycetes bacterium MalM25]|nr:bifunctional tRNA (mnm(5)s(2)U34)-methyltransferase/FAD-dependent cmnm(5)s(2)U34 oxidoreductase [Planctomycetes bacterium MalM25]
MPPRHTDVLILGQGLAGSALAWRLAERGVSAVVVDRGGVDGAGRPSASRVAAGLITPVTGKRLTVAEEFDTQWRSARDFYRRVESEVGESLLAERPAIRLFIDDAERARFDERLLDDEFQRHTRLATASELPEAMPAPWGGFVMTGAARLNVGAYLAATRDRLQANDRYLQAELKSEHELTVTASGVAIRRLGVTARLVVLCQGHAPGLSDGRLAPATQLAPAKGEVLTIESPTLRDARVVHRGVWIAPDESGLPGRFRVGSTHTWEDLNSTPTAAGREELVVRLAAAGVSDYHVVDHQAAIRPATSDRRPLSGFSEEAPRVGWLNGLGSKGSLWAPWYADRLAERIAREGLESP